MSTEYKKVRIFRDQIPVYDTNTCYSVNNLGQRTRNALLEMVCSMCLQRLMTSFLITGNGEAYLICWGGVAK